MAAGPALTGSLTVALGQAEFTLGEVDDNLDVVAGLAREATAARAELLVIPELAVTGYTTSARSLDRAEPIDGAIVTHLGKVAAGNGIAIVGSVLEQAGDHVFNSAVVLDAGGELVAVHRKTHLFASESHVFETGDDPCTVVSIGDFEVGVLICYEAEFPEMVRGLALRGVDLVAVPTATTTYRPGSRFARQVIGARATENNVFVAYANHCGPSVGGDYMGGSLIAGPRAEIVVEAGTAREVCTARLDRIDRFDAAAITPYLDDRRPDLYPR